MKTLNELFDVIKNDEKLRIAFSDAIKAKKLDAFLQENDCNATQADVEAYLKEELEKTRSLSPEDLSKIAGGDGLEIHLSDTELPIPWLCDPNYTFNADPNADAVAACVIYTPI